MADIEVGQVWHWHERPIPCGKWCHRCGEKHVERARDLEVIEIGSGERAGKIRVRNVEHGNRTWIRDSAFGVECSLVGSKP